MVQDQSEDCGKLPLKFKVEPQDIVIRLYSIFRCLYLAPTLLRMLITGRLVRAMEMQPVSTMGILTLDMCHLLVHMFGIT